MQLLPGAAEVHLIPGSFHLLTLCSMIINFSLLYFLLLYFIGKSFCFVRFDSHRSARQILEESKQAPITYLDKQLSLGWTTKDRELSSSAGSDSLDAARDYSRRQVLLAPPSVDSTTLFLGGLPPSTTEKNIEDIFGDRLSVISVRRPAGRDFAFVEFDSHEMASRAMADLGANSTSLPPVCKEIQTGEFNSGIVASQKHVLIGGQQVAFGWARGRPAERMTSHDGDCWFCLKSPTLTVGTLSDHGRVINQQTLF